MGLGKGSLSKSPHIHARRSLTRALCYLCRLRSLSLNYYIRRKWESTLPNTNGLDVFIISSAQQSELFIFQRRWESGEEAEDCAILLRRGKKPLWTRAETEKQASRNTLAVTTLALTSGEKVVRAAGYCPVPVPTAQQLTARVQAGRTLQSPTSAWTQML